jgi:hypothetical protein
MPYDILAVFTYLSSFKVMRTCSVNNMISTSNNDNISQIPEYLAIPGMILTEFL